MIRSLDITPALRAALAAVDREEADPAHGFLPLEMALVRLANEVRRAVYEQTARVPADRLARLPPRARVISIRDVRRRRGAREVS